MSDPSATNHADRLESLWSGEFGSDYAQRNRDAAQRREGFWNRLLDALKPLPRTVLEVGCNVGGNLTHIAARIQPIGVYGVDINRSALHAARVELPDVNLLWSRARELPFRDGWFDLAFTMGVLIHQPDDALPLVMNEVVRTSRRWVLCGEYHADENEEVAYRGQQGALFRRNYGRLYTELFPGLVQIDGGQLSAEDGFDRVTYHLFEKR